MLDRLPSGPTHSRVASAAWPRKRNSPTMDFDFDEDFIPGMQTGKSSSSSNHKAKTGQKKPSKVKGKSEAKQPRKNKKIGVKKATQKKRPAATPEMQAKARAH